MAEEKTTRIVLLGKSGTGKSSLANTLFREKDVFEVGGSANSVTVHCKSETRTIYGRKIQLIDTPGCFDTVLNKDVVKSEILRCITEAAPGPHAFLLVLTVGRFTPQEQEVVNLMVNEYFGEEALKYTTVVFTHGNNLEEGKKIEDWVKENTALKNLLEKCNNRCCVFDNKYWKKNKCLLNKILSSGFCEARYRNNRAQVKNLLNIIDKTVENNGGGYYSNKLLQDVQKRIEEKYAELKQSSPSISEKTLLQKAKEFVYNLLKNSTTGVVLEALLRAFLRGDVGAAVGAAIEAVWCAFGQSSHQNGISNSTKLVLSHDATSQEFRKQ